MPTYTYTCPEGHEHDELLPIAARHSPQSLCPRCGSAYLTLVIRGTVHRVKDGNIGRVYSSEAEIEAVAGKRWRETTP